MKVKNLQNILGIDIKNRELKLIIATTNKQQDRTARLTKVDTHKCEYGHVEKKTYRMTQTNDRAGWYVT